jgi:hypothetical protein
MQGDRALVTRIWRSFPVLALAVGLVTLSALPAGAEPGFRTATIVTPPSVLPVGSLPYRSISCPTTTSCTVAGPQMFFSTDATALPYAKTETSGVWSAPVSIQLPANNDVSPSALRSVAVTSISCDAVGSCSMVGLYPVAITYAGTKAAFPMAFAATESAGLWSAAVEIPLPQPSSPGLNESELNSVSCVIGGTCVAVGEQIESQESLQGLDASSVPFWTEEVAGTWSPPSVLATPPADGNDSFLDTPKAISCVDALDCTVGGDETVNAEDDSDQTSSWVVAENAGVWDSVTTPIHAPSKKSWILSSLSCSTVTNCVAVGYGSGPASVFDFGVVPIVAVESASKWSTAENLPLPKLSPLINGGLLLSVSCLIGSICEAVGFGESDSFFSDSPQTTIAATYANGVWSSFNELSHERLPKTVPATDSEMAGVSCVSTTNCVVLGLSAALPIEALTSTYSFVEDVAPRESLEFPGAPIAVNAIVRDKVPVVTWAPPTSDGGSAIKLFSVTAKTAHELPRHCSSAGYSCKLGGAIVDRTYLIDVVATNAVGHSKTSKVFEYKIK